MRTFLTVSALTDLSKREAWFPLGRFRSDQWPTNFDSPFTLMF